MQNKIIALAIAAAFATPVAMADTGNVNVYAFIDGGLRSDTGAGLTNNTFGTGTYNSNRWGIKGSEDLGNGMQATFGLEGGFHTGTGDVTTLNATPNTNLFNRIATVGVITSVGKVDLGRQFTVSFKTINLYDPFRQNYITLTNAFANINSPFYDNDISYTAKFGDLVVMAEHTVPGTGDDSTSASALGFRYITDTIFAGAAYTATKAAAATNNADAKHITVGGGFNFGDGKVYVGYAKNEVAPVNTLITNTNAITTNMWVGASYNVSTKIGVTAAYYKRTITAAVTPPTATVDLVTARMMVATTYALSKRTNLYAEIDKTTAETGTTTVTSADSNGYSLGVAHTF